MNKYEVKTDIFADINKGEAITLDSRCSIWLDEDGVVVFDDPTLVHRNPQWFKKIEKPEWEVDWFGICFGDLTNCIEMGSAQMQVTNGKDKIRFDGMTKEQAEAIATALNELDNESQ